MAKRRMISQQIAESDAFLDLPLTAQALYLHLLLHADDDGFVNNAKTIARMVGAKAEDLDALNEKRFILAFEDGVIVVKHWRINNQIRRDRYQVTQYRDHAERLFIKANGSYTFDESKGVMAWSPLI